MKLRICAPDIFAGDAVGNHCLGIARIAKRLGIEANLYAQRFDATVLPIVPLSDLFDETDPDDLLLVSYSIFDPLLDQLLALPCRKLCYFHGVTEPDLLREFEPHTADLCQAAHDQFPQLVHFDAVVSNSHLTARSLAKWIEPSSVFVIPPVFKDMPAFQRLPRGQRQHRLHPNLLLVGRVVPHKCVEDAITILALLHQHKVECTLSIVGGMPNYDYSKFLINHARALGVLDKVNFMGVIDDEDLLDCYGGSSGLLVMSRHEGFCVPVLEAMHFGKPVFVRGGTAAQEICTTSSMFETNAPLDTWAEAIAATLSKPVDTQSDSVRAEIDRAHEILLRTDAPVWARVLRAASGGGDL